MEELKMNKKAAAIGATMVGALTTGVISGMIVNRALKYDAKELEKDLKKKDAESAKKNMTFKDKVLTGVSFGLGATLVGLGYMTATSTAQEILDSEFEEAVDEAIEAAAREVDEYGYTATDLDDENEYESDKYVSDDYEVSDEVEEYQSEEAFEE